MQRKQRQLQTDTHHQKSKCRKRGGGIFQLRQPVRQILHIQGAGETVEKPDANQNECGADRTDNQILIGSPQRPSVSTLGNQRIGCQ